MEVRILKEDIKDKIEENRYDEDKNKNIVILTDAQDYALRGIRKYYTDFFIDNNTEGSFPHPRYISDREEIKNLSDFFFWGA